MTTPGETKLAALDRAAAALSEAEGILSSKPPTPTRTARLALIRKARAQVQKARSALSTDAAPAVFGGAAPTVAKSAPDGGVSSALGILQSETPWRSGGRIVKARTNAPGPTVAKAAPPDDVQADGATAALATLRRDHPWRGGRP